MLVHRSSPVVTIADNYETLGYPADAPAREARYTRYVDDRRLLRTHMTAMVPEALRRLVAPATPTTSSWRAPASSTAATWSTACTSASRTSSTCGGCAAAGR